MLHLNKLWHRRKSENEIVIYEASLSQHTHDDAVDVNEADALDVLVVHVDDSLLDIQADFIDSHDQDERASECVCEAPQEAMAHEIEQACQIMFESDITDQDAPLKQETIAGLKAEDEQAAKAEHGENIKEPILCGVQLRMPSAAINGDPVVRFLGGTGEENIEAERPVFNLLSPRADRDDRLAMHPGFKDVRMALARWQNAVHYFESVTNPDLIDFAVYELEAAKRQYVFLLKLAKDDLRREGILASGGA